MTPIRRYAVAALILIASATGCLSVVGSQRPNILYMMADDHTSQAWGCYGSRLAEYAHTPNIDRLASEGARLINSFCVNSICVPSRASVLTGQYSHLNGVKTLRDSIDPKQDNVAKQLRAAGYQTAVVGKWHLKTEPAGFDYWNIIRNQGVYHSPTTYEMSFEKPTQHKGKYSADVFTDLALDWLNARDKNKPFALMLHFKATHEPFQFPARLKDLYQNVVFPEPEDLFGATGPKNSRIPGWPLEILKDRMVSGVKHGDGRLELASDDLQEQRRETYQKFVRDFLRTGAAIDENVGRVLAWLDHQNLSQNTVVIYTSDQGYFLGEHNYFDKRFMYEQSLRMPFVLRYPAEVSGGSLVHPMILNIDFAPTLLDFANHSIPSSIQGRSFRHLLNGQSDRTWRKSMYYRYWENSEPRPSHYGIRTAKHKLIYYDGLRDATEANRWEFYDLINDPHELTNQYEDAGYQKTIASLKLALNGLQTEFRDIPE